METIILGIITGLTAATSQSCSYLFSKRFISSSGNSYQLLVVSHLIMGVFAAALLPFLLMHRPLPPLMNFGKAVILCNVYYLLAQCAFFLALKQTDASRLAPLLGLKILFLAGISIIFLHNTFNGLQWLGVLLCLGGAVMSNWSGGSIPVKSAMLILVACCGFSLSDTYIKILIDSLGYENIFFGASMAGVVSYVFAGICSIPMLFIVPGISFRQLKPAMPFSICWFVAMLLLFSCFGLIGPVFGNIIQSSRGIISVIIGAIVAGYGFSTLETRLNPGLLGRRIIAAALISAAVILFILGGQH